MWYAVIGRDAPDSLPKRKSQRAAHLERVVALRDQGRILLAGPFPASQPTYPGMPGAIAPEPGSSRQATDE